MYSVKSLFNSETVTPVVFTKSNQNFKIKQDNLKGRRLDSEKNERERQFCHNPSKMEKKLCANHFSRSSILSVNNIYINIKGER